jgi:hypothetical protein
LDDNPPHGKRNDTDPPSEEAPTVRRTLPLWVTLLLPTSLPGVEWEPPNFTLMGHLGSNYSTGFIPAVSPGVTGGLRLGASLSSHLDGYWVLDYHSMPGLPVTLIKPSPSNPQTLVQLRPTDDLSIGVRLRWTLDPKWDLVRERFREAPYLFGGASLNFLVDQFDRPEGLAFYNASYDLLFGMDFGLGMDFPLGDGRTWILCLEVQDHMLFWQGLTHVLSARAGIKWMLDSESLDPFR